MKRVLHLLICAAVLAGGGRVDGARVSAPATAVTSPPRAVSYRPPLPAPLRVLRRFAPPKTPYGPGHLGVDLASVTGQPVRAAAAGVVSFAGPVAGRGVVVVAHADGVRTEYEPVRVRVRAGTVVRSGQVIGWVAGRHGRCPPGGCLHWGARRDGAYLDPLLLLRGLGPVRLLPWTGS